MYPLRFFVYSDYLCPWCQNASVRLRGLEREYAGRVELVWKSYLLRPERRQHADREAALEKFRAYTKSWLRPGSEPDAGEFRVWQSDEGPPSHSVPAHLVAKAAARLGRDAHDRIHDRLMRAYFKENRDISRQAVLKELWDEVGLPTAAFAVSGQTELLDEVIADHQEALEAGATGVPAVRLEGNPAVIVGAHPVELYRRWIERMLERQVADREEAAS
jgi:predicted DsbA family dithiol-disulfide isomerase